MTNTTAFASALAAAVAVAAPLRRADFGDAAADLNWHDAMRTAFTTGFDNPGRPCPYSGEPARIVYAAGAAFGIYALALRDLGIALA